MRPPRVYRAEAIILRDRRLGEADKIITLYTAEYGKLDAVAKGVRRLTSRKRGHLEELSQSSLLLAHGRNLDVVTQSETIASFAALRSDLERLSRALYVAELVDRFTVERLENVAIYRLTLEVLQRLSDESALDAVVRYFELHLLRLSGYQPQLQHCASCRGAISPVLNHFSPTAGGVVCPGCRAIETMLRPLSVNALKVLRLMQTCSLGQATRIRMTAELATEIEGHLRVYIHQLLEHDVRSTEFIRTLRSGERRADSLLPLLPEGVLS
jgi:DNA repair protein RecO (recombination protein O)